MMTLFNFKQIQLRTTAPIQTKQLVKTRTAVHQETQHGLHSVHLELENQRMLKLHHTQDILFIFNLKLTQQRTIVLIQTKQPEKIKTAVLQVTQLGPHSAPQELATQQMPRLHHTQDILFIEIELKKEKLFKTLKIILLHQK